MTLTDLPARGPDDTVNVVVETPRGSTSKLKFDPALGAMTLSRPLPAGISYPHDWGFVPSTRGADGDPLDAMVMWEGTGFPGVVISCRLLGVLQAEQTDADTGQRHRNDRLIAVPVKSMSMMRVRSVGDLTERARVELEEFFLNSVRFEAKQLRILGWAGPEAAQTLVG